MSNFIEKLSNNFVGTHQDKKQIILTHTSRDVEEYLMSLKYRMNGKFTRIPHYIIAKDGSVIQTLSEEHYSDFFHYPQINEESIIISLENLGWLEKVPLKDQYTNWIGNIYKGSAYEKKWRDYFLWEPYTEIQMQSAAELCIKLVTEHKIEKKCIGHNTKIDNVDKLGGIVSRSNFETIYTDVSPAFNFEKFTTYIKNEQLV